MSMKERWQKEAEAEEAGEVFEEIQLPEDIAERLKPVEETTKLAELPDDLPFFDELEGPEQEDLGPDVQIEKVSPKKGEGEERFET